MFGPDLLKRARRKIEPADKIAEDPVYVIMVLVLFRSGQLTHCIV